MSGGSSLTRTLFVSIHRADKQISITRDYDARSVRRAQGVGAARSTSSIVGPFERTTRRFDSRQVDLRALMEEIGTIKQEPKSQDRHIDQLGKRADLAA